MSEYVLLFKSDRCIGCYACEVACKSENQIPAGRPSWIRLMTIGPREVGGKLKLDFQIARCMHCGKAPCIDACPEGALSRSENGIVRIDEELCTGCKVCIEACPFAAPQFNPDKGVVEMCNLCSDRLEQGLVPACVQCCWTEALLFGTPSEVVSKLQEVKVGYSGF